MARVYLGLGSNIGDKKKNITYATTICGSIIGEIKMLSSLYESEPWGFKSSNKFLNAVICIETNETPQRCLEMAKAIEREMGRPQKKGDEYEDRVIDIDILLYDDLIMQSENLTIPHPLMNKRFFVLEPLAEIAPDLTHPIHKCTIKDLLATLSKTIER